MPMLAAAGRRRPAACAAHARRRALARGWLELSASPSLPPPPSPRTQAGTLAVADAVQLCYSYAHAAYSPVALLRPLTRLVVDQPQQLHGLPMQR